MTTKTKKKLPTEFVGLLNRMADPTFVIKISMNILTNNDWLTKKCTGLQGQTFSFKYD